MIIILDFHASLPGLPWCCRSWSLIDHDMDSRAQSQEMDKESLLSTSDSMYVENHQSCTEEIMRQ
jgi:hypothetical protein